MTQKMRRYFVAVYEKGVLGPLRAERVQGLTHLYRIIAEMTAFLTDDFHQIVIQRQRDDRPAPVMDFNPAAPEIQRIIERVGQAKVGR
jgi:hypothetical protein